jgi:two-component system, NtrC family, sensor histidine kinase HydH
MSDARVLARSAELFAGHRMALHVRTDRLFAWVMLAQWAFGVGVALSLSPFAWAGRIRTTHAHVYAAFLLGGVLSSLPIVLAWRRPGATATRHIIAVAQMLWSALLIHLSGGRIETHFHVFGSLAALSLYRDYKVLGTATFAVATDHYVRGIAWPESVYGVVTPEWWRFLEHAFWVIFAVAFLVSSCRRSIEELSRICLRQAETERLSSLETEKSRALDHALTELAASQEGLQRLAALGELTASVSHELRNPLAGITNATGFLRKKLVDAASREPRIQQFLDIIDRESAACTHIVGELLDFVRERPPALLPCPLRPLVAEAMSMVPRRGAVELSNDVRDDLPVPLLDKEQFRQVLINLIQNASEAMAPGRDGRVTVRAEAGEGRPLCLVVSDNGTGMTPEVAARVFQPLFTTKPRGTGLGLSVVQTIVKRHGGRIHVDTALDRGTEFRVEVPASSGR